MIIYNSVISDLSAQKAWSLGKLSEENLIMRISNRINTNNTQLVPVIAGELALRPRYYQEKYDKKSPYLLNQSLLVRHIPSGMFNFYAQTPMFRTISQISDITPE
ncbi:MAG: hypothetical protein J6W96_05520 [Alphaproteobacteria bacterium]|nr:hypothetical protein [Alphaproteobacteria bacterium]